MTLLTCLVAAALANPPPPGHPSTPQGAPLTGVQNTDSVDAYTHHGKVLETANGGGYTYIRLMLDGKETWVAGPETEVKVGDRVMLTPGNRMVMFWSRTMDRTFEEILFVGGIRTGAVEAGAETGAEAAKIEVNDVKPLEGGLTVDQILKQAKDLSGQTVRLRATVVKVNSQIMGKNWLHLRDASSEQELTATTAETVETGSTLVISAKLATDQNFGAGYSYPIILEEAKIEQH